MLNIVIYRIEVVKINKRIVYSVLTVAIVFLIMTVYNIYQERTLVHDYKTVTLKKFKYDEHYDSIFKKKKERIKIHISGAVKNPGFYEVSPGIKLKTIINKVINLRDDANLDPLNLNKKVYNKDQIIIPHSR
jgi:competence protein ComEA